MLNATALSNYSQGRLAANDGTALILVRSLATARRYCGWHVSPALTQQVTIDGSGGPLIQLPTLRVTAITAVTEDGTAIDLDDLEWSQSGSVRKRDGSLWTSRLGGVTVSMTHGFDDTIAADFESAVLSLADRSSQPGGLPTSIGPFRWADDKTTSGAFTGTELAILEQYRLERIA